MCQISKIIQHGYSIVANLQQYEQMLQKLYCFIFSFLSPLSSFFLFSSLSLFGSLSLLPVPVPSLFDQSEMFIGSDDGVASMTTTRSTTLDQPCSISPTLQQFGLIWWWCWAVGYGAIGFRSRWRLVLGIGHSGDCVWDRFWVLVVSPSSVVWVLVSVAVGVSVVELWLESVGAWVESVAGDGYFGLGWIGVKIGWCSWVFWHKRHGRGHSDHRHCHHRHHRRSSCRFDLADLSLFFCGCLF